MLDVRVWRGGETGIFQAYRVPRFTGQTVLDVVTHIQRHLDPTLSYRFACRVGVCGSCAMVVNGRSRWTCRSLVEEVTGFGPLTIAPLRNFPVIKDLCVDMSDFFDNMGRAQARFQSADPDNLDSGTWLPDSRARRNIDASIECIGCGICHSACESALANGDYLGPAVLNRVWTLMIDERDGAKKARLSAIAGDHGPQGCHSHQSCSVDCPKSIDPARAIAKLKRSVFWATLTGRLEGQG